MGPLVAVNLLDKLCLSLGLRIDLGLCLAFCWALPDGSLPFELLGVTSNFLSIPTVPGQERLFQPHSADLILFLPSGYSGTVVPQARLKGAKLL